MKFNSEAIARHIFWELKQENVYLYLVELDLTAAQLIAIIAELLKWEAWQ